MNFSIKMKITFLHWLFFSYMFLFLFTFTNFFNLQADLQQGEIYRLIYSHVPFAWLSLITFALLVLFSLYTAIKLNRITNLVCTLLSLVGTFLTFLTISTGVFWGRRTWGTFWVWDIRLSSVLVLFLVFLIFWLTNKHTNLKIKPLYHFLIGFTSVNLPIIKYSVEWWNTLHQRNSITIFESQVDPLFLSALYLNFTGLAIYFLFYFLLMLEQYYFKTKIQNRKMKNLKSNA